MHYKIFATQTFEQTFTSKEWIAWKPFLSPSSHWNSSGTSRAPNNGPRTLQVPLPKKTPGIGLAKSWTTQFSQKFLDIFDNEKHMEKRWETGKIVKLLTKAPQKNTWTHTLWHEKWWKLGVYSNPNIVLSMFSFFSHFLLCFLWNLTRKLCQWESSAGWPQAAAWGKWPANDGCWNMGVSKDNGTPKSSIKT